MPTTIQYVRSGQLRALAVTTSVRSQVLPDVPTVSEFVTSYEASSWHGIGAAKDTAGEIIQRLNKEVGAALGDPAMNEHLAALGGVPMPMSPIEFGKLIADETAKWAEVIKIADAKID